MICPAPNHHKYQEQCDRQRQNETIPTLDQYLDVVRVREVVGLNQRMLRVITWLKADDASRLRMKQHWTQAEALVVHHLSKQVFKYLHAEKNKSF